MVIFWLRDINIKVNYNGISVDALAHMVIFWLRDINVKVNYNGISVNALANHGHILAKRL